MRYLLMTLIFYWPHITSGSEIITIGWIEPVKIFPEEIEIQAKIDTGADTSSLGVVDWKSYLLDGEEWIRFIVINNHDREQIFERPLDRYTRIKRKQEESLKRPVIKMWLCIDNKLSLTSVNLAKRNKFKYSMLIGRSLLRGKFLVDSATKQTTSPQCAFPE